MKRNSKKQLQAPMAKRLERIEQKTDQVLTLLGNIYRQMIQAKDSSKEWAEAVENLDRATKNLQEARQRESNK